MLFTPNFLPCIAYFSEIINSEEVRLNSDDVYVKQTYRNRARILGANKVENLIVPVHATSKKTPAKDVKIDHHEPWQRQHLRTLEAAYRRSPFYEFYDYIFMPLFEKKYIFLLDLQLDSLEKCLFCLQLKKTIRLDGLLLDEDLMDLKPKDNSYLKTKYSFPPYYQSFGGEFTPNLSIMDLLCYKGPEALTFLAKKR